MNSISGQSYRRNARPPLEGTKTINELTRQVRLERLERERLGLQEPEEARERKPYTRRVVSPDLHRRWKIVAFCHASGHRIAFELASPNRVDVEARALAAYPPADYRIEYINGPYGAR